MNSPVSGEFYRASLVPALQAIQSRFGYLQGAALREYSENSGVPLYRLQAVASFFAHFHLSVPKKVTLHVCRDLACHVAGSRNLLADLQGLESEQVAIEGVSCLGRCDRAPAACLTIAGQHEEQYYLGRSLAELRDIIAAAAQTGPPAQDLDVAYTARFGVSRLDSYDGSPPGYEGVRKVLAARDNSLDAALAHLRTQKNWNAQQLGEFRAAAVTQLRTDFKLPAEIVDAVRCWQIEAEWAKGPEIGGWADAFFKELDAADLRGLGGAGIPASQKWKDVRDAVRDARRREVPDRAFIVVNGDESEPGTFKDREILLRDPHTVVEGVILAGLLTEAAEGFIYIRHEYPEQIAACRAEIQRAGKLGFCGENASQIGRSFPVSVFVSPGGYICGEQSALIEAMSDRRAEPRNMPPKLETNGLLDLPTLVSNVETFAWTPFIMRKGGKAYADEGVNGWKGRRLFSICGDVKRPGVYEVPMGLTLRELVEGADYCQGMAGGRKLKAFAPSGPSGGFLPAMLKAPDGLPRDHTKNKTWLALAERRGFDPAATELDILDLELELNLFRALSPTAALGAGLCVYSEDRDMVGEAVKSLEFFRNESCGKCVPCRLGSQKLASLGTHLVEGKISSERWEKELVPLIKELNTTIGLTSICGLGRSVPMPLTTVLKFFPADVAKHLSPANGEAHP
jgi:NADH:ubiquinone oxidoreductase subunit F (NADH-binding)/NADH:ubiquinone oxidoreductase subunit E